MKLEQIEAQNLKGRSFSFQLDERTAIVGPNFVGKTAVLEAIRLLLIGHIPEVGKRASSTFEMASSHSMRVSGQLSGSSITRNFSLEGLGVKTTLDHDAGDLVERCRELPLLNAEHYFSLTDRERTNYVFERIELPANYTPEAIIAEAERVSFGEKHSEEHEKAKAGFIKTLRTCLDGTRLQDALNDAMARFKEAFTYWNQRSKETVGAVRVLAELKNRESEASAETLAEIDAAIKDTESKLDAIAHSLEELSASKREAEHCESRMKQLRAWLSEDLIDYPRMITQAEEKIAQLQSQRMKVPPESEQVTSVSDLYRLQQERTDASTNVTLIDHKITDLAKQIDRLTAAQECPTCHARGTDWKQTVLAELREQKDQAQARWEGALRALEVATKQADERKAFIEGWKQATSRNRLLDEQTGKLKRDIESWKEKASSRDDFEKKLKDELTALEGRAEQNAGSQVKYELCRGERDGLLSKLKDLRQRQQKTLTLQQDLKRGAQSQLEHINAVANLEVVKALAHLVQDKRTQMIEDVFGRFLRTANSLCGGILKSPLALHDGTIGRWEGSVFVPHRVFSGVEKALAYVAIAMAHSEKAPFKLLLLDEMARMTGYVRARVLERVAAAVGQTIDQAIVVIPTDRENFALPGWKVIQVR